MKIYVNEETRDVRIDFGEEEYARVSVSQFTGQVFTEVAPTRWLPDVLGDSEPVYETPVPPLEWPTKPNAHVEARTPLRTKERLIRHGSYWAAVEDGSEYYQSELEPKRIIFEGEDNV